MLTRIFINCDYHNEQMHLLWIMESSIVWGHSLELAVCSSGPGNRMWRTASMSCTSVAPGDCLPIFRFVAARVAQHKFEGVYLNQSNIYFLLTRIVAYEFVSIVKTNQRSISKEEIYTTHFVSLLLLVKAATNASASPIFHSEMGITVHITILG